MAGRKAGSDLATTKQDFLRHMQRGLNINQALAAVDRQRSTYEVWRKNDPEFVSQVERIKTKEIQIELDDLAKDFLADKGYDPDYGARPMRRAVERHLEDPMAEELLRGTIKTGDTVKVSALDGKLTFTVPESAAAGEPAGEVA